MKGRYPALLLFPALAAFAVAVPAAAAPPDFAFYGNFDFDDAGSFLLLPFDVPGGTTSIGVSYDYEWCSGTGGGKGLGDPVVDIGLYDTEKFRGWSGSNKSSFTLSESRGLTTDSYTPGEILAGEWAVELGVTLIDPGAVIHYSVEIELDDDPVGEPFVWPAREDVVLSEEAKWYRGDLHCHSTHSDGRYPMEDVFDYAAERGLDFLALTDHNGFSHMLYLGEMQALYPELLLLYGEEMTSYRGHANVFDIYRPVDYHGTSPGYDINAVIDGIHADGGFFSPNHPAMPFFPVGDSYLGLGWAYPETDWARVDFFEVVNGPSVVFENIPNVLNTLAILWWESLLDAGHRITAIGGSDDHSAGQGGGDTYAPTGMPTTMVHAAALSAQAIFEAIRAGHVTILCNGPDGPFPDFTAAAGGMTAMPGDRISGREISFRVEIEGARGMAIHIWKDGLPWLGQSPVEIDEDTFTHTFLLNPKNEGRIRVEVKDGPYLAALTNPIFYEAVGLCAAMPALPGREAAPSYLALLFLPLAFAAVMKARHWML